MSVEVGAQPDSLFRLQVIAVAPHERQQTPALAGDRIDLSPAGEEVMIDETNDVEAVGDDARMGEVFAHDGARYPSARSARDRDRLRQAVLEGLGWWIHRIWSTDWFHNPDAELRKVVQAIETARDVGPLGNLDMHMVDRTRLADFLAQVVAVESPVHWTEAARRVLSGAGIQRLGTRIQTVFEEAVKVGVSRKLFDERGEFLRGPAMQQPPVRDRSALSRSW
jgi:hypothetical protein